MQKFKAYLQSEYKLLLFFLLTALIFGGIFLFAPLPMDYFFLGMESLGFVLLTGLIVGWFQFQKQRRLEQEIRTLAEQNRSLLSRIADERTDLQAYFLMWVHQMKTPITVSGLLLRKRTDDDARKLKEQLFYIEEYTDMAMNYLKLTDRRADMVIAPVKIDDLIKPLVKKYAMLMIEKGVALRYTPIEHTVVCDAKWLSVLVEQLLANAVKYTDKGEISILYDPASACLTLRDTGIGIRTEDIPKIFDRGYSGFNGRISQKSSGLGLYLVKIIAGLLNVRIQVASQVGQGSAFSVHFPPNLTDL